VLTGIGLVFRSLISCVLLRFNCKQKILVSRVCCNKGGVTKLIEDLALELGCSVGCLWGNLRELRKIGLVCGGDLTELGEAVCLELKMKGGELNGK